MPLNDRWIREQAAAGMIKPFVPELVREVEPSVDDLLRNNLITLQDAAEMLPRVPSRRVLSYGCSSYGYDLRLSHREFFTFCHVPGTIVDPKKFNDANLRPAELQRDGEDAYYILPAHSYGLGVALEYLDIPPNVTVLFIGKSTYARCGVIANLTPGEAGWKGHLTLEFSNSSSADCRIYAGEGVVQALFFEGDPCDTTYADRSGKYQNQGNRVVTARV